MAIIWILYKTSPTEVYTYTVSHKFYPWSLAHYEIDTQNLYLYWHSALFQNTLNERTEANVYIQTNQVEQSPLLSSEPCPPRPSLMNTLAKLPPHLLSLPWQVSPVLYQNELCYFALTAPLDQVFADVPSLPAGYVVTQNTPSLTFDTPQWNFLTTQNTLQWQPADNQTTFTLSPAGLLLTNTHHDPKLLQLYSPLPAELYPAIKIKMRTTSGTALELFWKTPQLRSFQQESSSSISLIADNNWHEYVIPLAQHPHWQGMITELRLDPTNTPAQTEIEYITFLKN